MKIIQVKSLCCEARVCRYGKRRRQCSRCKKTWRIRKKKRGRKQLRVTTNIVSDVLVRGETITQRSQRGRLSARQYQLRYHRSVEERVPKQWFPCVPFGKLILIADGLWTLTNRKQRFVVYLMAIRSINNTRAIFLPPIILKGSEIRRKWEVAFKTIPQSVGKRIVGLVCDGISGLPNSAQDRLWIVQRCHFHFIRVLERFLGKTNSKIQHKELRENMYRSIRRAMIIPYGEEYDHLIQYIDKLTGSPVCPKWINLHANEFLRHREDFRSYLRYPQYHFPATTGTMENLCGSIRDLLRRSRGFKTEESLRTWINAFIKMKRATTCNGKIQPN